MADAPKTAGIGGHHRAYRGRSDDWLTPPEIIEALGPFDLDPCACVDMPWSTAETMWTVEDDGRLREWFGRVWCNPPYGPELRQWVERLASHGNGIALIFARTETAAFFDHVWGKADAMLFIKGRLHFHLPTGERAKANAGGPSVLIAYGDANVESLRSSGVAGAFVDLREREVARG